MGYKNWKLILTKEFLYEEHVNKGKSLLLISKEVGCDHKTVSYWLHFNEVPYQEPKYNGRKMKNHPGWKGIGEISLTQLNNIKNNASTRKIPFDLSGEYLWNLYLSQNRKCALSGLEIGFIACRKGNASLDRIDSSKPYIEGNVQWVHTNINYAKQSLSNEDFIALCKNVVDWNNGKDY